jgi:ribosome maturation factor RimP
VTQLINDLDIIIQPLAKSAGATLYACQFVHVDGVASLRVMIDEEGGVNVQTCADLSRTINLVLEVDHPQLLEKYQLVVSSPGIERPLLNRSNYEQALGKQIAVTLKKAQNSVKRFEGRLESAEGESITIQGDSDQHTFTLNDIAKANILWNQGAKK